jgi:hypothetical protein
MTFSITSSRKSHDGVALVDHADLADSIIADFQRSRHRLLVRSSLTIGSPPESKKLDIRIYFKL